MRIETASLIEGALSLISRTRGGSPLFSNGTTKLVYYEKFLSRNLAVRRQRQIERLVHKKRAELVESVNPEWLDVSGFI